MDNFIVNINCVVVAANIALNKQYLLSANADNYTPLSFSLSKENLNDLDTQIVKRLKEHIFVNELELWPQLINLHSKHLSSEHDNTLNVVYGFVVSHTININNAHWLEFNVLDEKPYTHLVLEVIQKLQ